MKNAQRAACAMTGLALVSIDGDNELKLLCYQLRVSIFYA